MAGGSVADPCGSNSSMKKPPHFTKILIHSTLQDNKLKLPQKFVQRFGNEISGICKLKVADGCVWRVQIWKDDGGNIWFEDGWNDIVSYYSLRYGSLLFFKYESDRSFHVIICDGSNSEIDYPCNNGEIDSETEDEDHVDENEDGKEILDLLEEMDIYVSNSLKSLSVKESKFVIEAARFFNPRNPSFMVIMLQTFISKSYLYIPGTFRKYLSPDVKFVKLQVSGGKEWTVEMKWNARKCVLTCGWNKFVKDQNLKEEDLCLFELAEKTKKSDVVLLKFSMLNASVD